MGFLLIVLLLVVGIFKCGDGESRTPTGYCPQRPERCAYTISPHPLRAGNLFDINKSPSWIHLNFYKGLILCAVYTGALNNATLFNNRLPEGTLRFHKPLRYIRESVITGIDNTSVIHSLEVGGGDKDVVR